MRSEAAARADFTVIRYGQVWEDADVLLQALDVRPGDVCVSIASAGDNVLALLARSPGHVHAVDLNPAQIACLELRVAAYKVLAHRELLELIGSRPSARRATLYARCRPALSPRARWLWDGKAGVIERGIGSAGKLERYFEAFRTYLLPLVHDRDTIAAWLEQRDSSDRVRFYAERWDTWRWRLLFKLFFSRAVMGRAGRDPAFFDYVDGDVASRILERTKHAFADLDPASNPYLHWILFGTHGDVLPYALREEHFDTIRNNLDRLSWHVSSLEGFIQDAGEGAFDRFNLSNLFEYVSIEHYQEMLEAIVRASRPGARLVYWNLLAPRRRPATMAGALVPLEALAAKLHRHDRAFFYGALRVEEVR